MTLRTIFTLIAILAMADSSSTEAQRDTRHLAQLLKTLPQEAESIHVWPYDKLVATHSQYRDYFRSKLERMADGRTESGLLFSAEPDLVVHAASRMRLSQQGAAGVTYEPTVIVSTNRQVDSLAMYYDLLVSQGCGSRRGGNEYGLYELKSDAIDDPYVSVLGAPKQ